MSNESPPPPGASAPEPSPATPSSDLQIELARQRAAAADAWRGYVESGAVIQRQRAQFLDVRNRELEAQLFLASEREARASEELERLNTLAQHLESELQATRKQLAEIQIPEPTVAQRLKARLKASRPGRLAHTLAEYLRLLSRPQREPEIFRAPDAEGSSDEPFTVAQSLDKAHRLGKGASQRGTVLFFTSEAEDTGEGRLVLELVECLQKSCDVVVFQMAEGPLLKQFTSSASACVQNRAARYDYSAAREAVHQLAEDVGEISFAIVVGVDTRSVLPALAELYIPALVLLPEANSYATSVYTYQEIFFWATHTCFTSEAALENARRICAYVNPHAISARVPGSGSRATPRLCNSAPPGLEALHHRIGLDAGSKRTAIVLGWGDLDYRSGVDLFLDCADWLKRHAVQGANADTCTRFRFIWLAQPSALAHDAAYGLAIQDQIKRMGLEDDVTIVYEPLSAEFPASLADLILFPARAELPQNGSKQIFEQGIPVVAFAGGTSLSAVLGESDLADRCLARAYDTEDMANKALALLTDSAQRTSVAERLRKIDSSRLSLDHYAGELLNFGNLLAAQVRQERDDEEVVTSSGGLKADYMGELLQYHGELQCSLARLYIRGWKAGIGARKPQPGLLPTLYSEAVDINPSEDAYARFLRDGSPEGPWRYPVIQPASNVPLPSKENFRVALHIHAYYPDMLRDMLSRLANNSVQPDLFISVKDAISREEAAGLLNDYSGKVVALEVVPNRGRDIGPFLTTFGERLLAYDLIGHLHTKRSPHGDDKVIEMWRRFLMENLLGGEHSGSMLDNIVCRMYENPSWGIAFPDDPVPIGWDANRQCAEALAARMVGGVLPTHFCFPAGSMFWIRSQAFQPFVKLGLQYDDYPVEPLPIDGTMLHAIERLFGVIPRAMGMQCALTTVPGISR